MQRHSQLLFVLLGSTKGWWWERFFGRGRWCESLRPPGSTAQGGKPVLLYLQRRCPSVLPNSSTRDGEAPRCLLWGGGRIRGLIFPLAQE